MPKTDESTFLKIVARLFAIYISMLSVVSILWLGNYLDKVLPQYYMVADSNMPLALLVAVSTFMWFKNIKISYSKWINAIGGSAFGVLLIHANSEAMRQWLWKDTIDCIGHYSLPLFQLVPYSILCVLAIYTICTIIDRIRIKTLEEPFFRWYDRKFVTKS